jgi:cell division protein FtsI (penicillin-binding protein 3)
MNPFKHLVTSSSDISNIVSKLLPHWRLLFIAFLLLLGVASIVGKLIELQITTTDELQNEGKKRSWRTEVMPAQRGLIFDRNKEPLAVSTPMKTVVANPFHMLLPKIDPKDKTEIRKLDLDNIRKIATLLELDYTALKNKIESYHQKNRHFLYIARQLPPTKVKYLEAARLSGVKVITEYKRFYPLGEVTAHTVGFTAKDGAGQEGLELSFEHSLKSEDGSLKVQLDKRGRVVRELEEQHPPKNGEDIFLTLDSSLQNLVHQELKKAVQLHGAKAASAVLMDPKTGEILALVNQPTYNPNNRATLHPEFLRNRAIVDVFEPGSVMKPFTIAAALESGEYGIYTKIDTNSGRMTIGGHTITDSGRNLGVIDLTGIITKSSNIGAAKIGLFIGSEVMWNMLYSVGFGTQVGLGFPGERTGSLPSYNKWPKARLATLSYGYGLNVNAIQLARAYSSIANDGILPGVTLVQDQITDEPVRVMAAKTAQDIRRMLKTVLEKGGTGTKANLDYYTAGGKTGTVRKLDSNGYSEDKYRALFVGMAPIENPDLVLVIVIDEPNGNKSGGGSVSAPIFGDIMDRALQLRSITPEKLEQRIRLN